MRHDTISKASPVKTTDAFGHVTFSRPITQHVVPKSMKRKRLTKGETQLVRHLRGEVSGASTGSQGL